MSEIFSLEKTCRTCLGNLNAESISLYDDVFIQDQKIISMKDVLNLNCCIEIVPEDGLPKHICMDCMQKLKEIYLFYIQCQSSEELLRKYKIDNNISAHQLHLDGIKIKNNAAVEVIIDEITLDDNASLLILGESTKSQFKENDVKNDNDNIASHVQTCENHVEKKQKTYHCADCEISFHWRIKYNEHIRKFHKFTLNVKRPKQYTCSICNKSFGVLSDLEKHNRKCTSKSSENTTLNNDILVSEDKVEFSREHICPSCRNCFETLSELRSHMKLHVKDMKYGCSSCNKSFCNESNLDRHVRKQHLQTHICNVCNKTFLNQRKLRLHATCHTAESDKKYKCRYCIKKFNQVHHLENHERIHTGQKPYLCNECGKGFRQQYALTLHMRIHTGDKPYICQECGKTFNRKQGLDSHLLCHSGKRDDKVASDGKPHICTECGIRVTRLHILIKHMWEVHKKCDDPILLEQAKQQAKLRKDDKVIKGVTYACNVCDTKFQSNLKLKQHMKVHAFQYICSVCSRAFMLRSQLEAHSRFHTGSVRLHPCSHPGCTRSFNRPEHARAHYMRAHTTERPYQCEVCLKGFCQSGDLKVHMRYHTGERPYDCSFCDKSFAASSALKGHMRRHTGERPYCCAICQNGYYTSTELNLHMKSHTSKSIEIATDVIDNQVLDIVNK